MTILIWIFADYYSFIWLRQKEREQHRNGIELHERQRLFGHESDAVEWLSMDQTTNKHDANIVNKFKTRTSIHFEQNDAKFHYIQFSRNFVFFLFCPFCLVADSFICQRFWLLTMRDARHAMIENCEWTTSMKTKSSSFVIRRVAVVSLSLSRCSLGPITNENYRLATPC